MSEKEVLPTEIGVTVTPINGSLSLVDVTALVALISGMLERMESSILSQMQTNSDAARDRWKLHDEAAKRDRDAAIARFAKIESSLDNHIAEATLRWKKEHDDEVASNARVEPVRKVIGYTTDNWRTILLVVIGIISVLSFLGDNLHHIIPWLPQ